MTAEVAKVLASAGFPNIMSFYDGAPADFERLQQALHAFLYGKTDEAPDGPEFEGNEPLAELVEDVSAGHRVFPVEFRLAGDEDAVTRATEVIGHVFTVTYTSAFYRTRDGRTRVYLTGSRLAPFRGGLK